MPNKSKAFLPIFRKIESLLVMNKYYLICQKIIFTYSITYYQTDYYVSNLMPKNKTISKLFFPNYGNERGLL